MSLPYIVAHFLATDEVSVVPENWIIQDSYCKWPPFDNTLRVKKAVLENAVPDTTWAEYEIVVMGRYDTYHKAKAKAEKALDTSNLETSTFDSDISDTVNRKLRGQRRKTVQPYIVVNDELSLSSGSENELFVSPKKKTKKAFPQPPRIPMEDVPAPLKNSYGMASMEEVPTPLKSNYEMASKQKQQTLMDAAADAGPTRSERCILKMLENITNVQQQHTIMLRQFLPATGELLSPNCFPKLPVDSVLELKELEAFLNDVKNFSNMVKYFGSRIGGDVSQSTRRLLTKVMTNEFAKNFNWAGRPPKQAFKTLKIVTFIIGAIHENPSTKDASGADIEATIKDWLKHASFRANYAWRKSIIRN